MIILKNYCDLSPQEHHALLTIRNLESIRNTSGNRETIDFQHHLEWIESLKHSNQKFYYAVVENDTLRGGLHLIRDDDHGVTWGIFFDPKTPLGLIASVTLYFIDRCFESLGLQTLRSLIRTENTGAIAFNRQLGFKPLEENDDFVLMELDKLGWNAQKEKKILKNILQYAAHYPIQPESL
ncbi:GNAT family protein [uncultured Sulfuricurvum sp.]|uniref:GNAT family N-acetyltransferase n=1 Tax=Sulfuricurvum sp. TaxID=2025608 RepID=UPI0026164C3B|nr:GNAT family protein [uncultured Sulfuricurvum sp.]